MYENIRSGFEDRGLQEMMTDYWFEAQIKRGDFWAQHVPSRSAIYALARKVDDLGSGCAAHHLARGSINFLLRNDAGAADSYKAAARMSEAGAFLHRAAWGCFTVASQESVLDFATNMITPPWLGDVEYLINPAVSKGEPIILVTCDEVYFAAFSSDLVRSVIDNNSTKHVHFHVANPSGYTSVHYDRLSVMSGATVSLSTERIDVLDLHAAYTTLRFLRMPAFLSRFGSDIVCIDADAKVTGDLSGMVRERHGNIGVRRFPKYPGYHPWRKVSAGAVFARPTEDSVGFFRMVGSYIAHVFDASNKRNWWIDQNALTQCFDAMSQFENLPYRNLGPAAARCVDFYHSKGDVLEAARAAIAAYPKSH